MIKDIITDSTFDIKKLFQAYNNNIAIETTEKNISYGELKFKILNVINFLEKSGVKPGQKIAIYKENSIHHIVLFLVSWIMKFLYVPLNFKTPINEAVSNLELDILFCDSIEEHADVKVFKTDELNTIDENNKPYSEIEPVHLDQEASVIFTSGSTGAPKGVVHTTGNYLYSSMGTIENLSLKGNDRWLLSLPLYHVGGILIFARTFLSGAASILPENNSNFELSIIRKKPGIISLVPTQLIRLLHSKKSTDILKSCKAVLIGGAAMPDWLTGKAYDLGIPIVPTYGSTESCAQITAVDLKSKKETYFTSGKTLKYRTIKIDRDNTIIIGGKTLFKYYVENNKKIFPFKNSMFKTKDMGRFDPGGNLIILGRKDQAFISGGENINPFEIEKFILAVNGISASVVVPVPHKEFGMVPWAFILADKKIEAEYITARLKKNLPAYKIPKKIIILNKNNNINGIKLNRPELKVKALEIAGRQ